MRSRAAFSIPNLKSYDGAITSNLAIVPLGNGSLTADSTNATHLILDVNGYFAP